MAVAPKSPQQLRDLQLSTIHPQVQAALAGHTAAMRKIAERAGHSSAALNLAIASEPAALRAQLDQHLALWTPAAPTEPTGDPAVEALTAQLIGAYSYHETTAFTASLVRSILRSIVEGAVLPIGTQGRELPGT